MYEVFCFLCFFFLKIDLLTEAIVLDMRIVDISEIRTLLIHLFHLRQAARRRRSRRAKKRREDVEECRRAVLRRIARSFLRSSLSMMYVDFVSKPAATQEW
jgi:hypothetical protein